VVDLLAGRLPEGDLRDAIVVATRRYAKRQETWFRHQLRGESGKGKGEWDVWTLDATSPPDELAATIGQRWRATTRSLSPFPIPRR
jgi:tRNA A37 N6-isopentenylltransferase MiaA